MLRMRSVSVCLMFTYVYIDCNLTLIKCALNYCYYLCQKYSSPWGRGGNVHIIGVLVGNFESGNKEYLMLDIFKHKNCYFKVFRHQWKETGKSAKFVKINIKKCSKD